MSKEEALELIDNLMICINEHPVIVDWLVEIENRKTEPQTCDTCEQIGRCDRGRAVDCPIREPQTDCAWMKGANNV